MSRHGLYNDMRFEYENKYLLVTRIIIVSIVLLLYSSSPLYAEESPNGAGVEALQQELRAIEKQIIAYEKNLSLTKKQRTQITSLIGTLKTASARKVRMKKFSIPIAM